MWVGQWGEKRRKFSTLQPQRSKYKYWGEVIGIHHQKIFSNILEKCFPTTIRKRITLSLEWTFRQPSFSQVQRELSVCYVYLIYLVRLIIYELLLAGVIIDSSYFWRRYFCWSYYWLEVLLTGGIIDWSYYWPGVIIAGGIIAELLLTEVLLPRRNWAWPLETAANVSLTVEIFRTPNR